MCEPEIHGIKGLVTSILNAPRQGHRRVVAIVVYPEWQINNCEGFGPANSSSWWSCASRTNGRLPLR